MSPYIHKVRKEENLKSSPIAIGIAALQLSTLRLNRDESFAFNKTYIISILLYQNQDLHQ